MIDKAQVKMKLRAKLPLVIIQLDLIRTTDKGNADVQK